MSQTPEIKPEYSAECRNCGKAVSRKIPASKGTTIPPKQRIRCADCGKTNWCTHEG